MPAPTVRLSLSSNGHFILLNWTLVNIKDGVSTPSKSRYHDIDAHARNNVLLGSSNLKKRERLRSKIDRVVLPWWLIIGVPVKLSQSMNVIRWAPHLKFSTLSARRALFGLVVYNDHEAQSTMPYAQLVAMPILLKMMPLSAWYLTK